MCMWDGVLWGVGLAIMRWVQFGIMTAINCIQTYNRMSWSEVNPYYAYIYPFYGYPIHLPFQKTAQTIPNLIISQPQPQEREIEQSCISNQCDPLLQMEGEDSKASLQLKRRSLRKQKKLKKRQREDNFARKKQKKDRNIPSNIFKYFITYLYYHPNLHQILPSNQQIHIDPHLLIGKLKLHIKETQTYIRPATIQQLCGHSILTPNQSLAFRILLKKFLLLDFVMVISPMQKFKKRQRKELINYGRKLLEQIKQKKFE